MSSENKKEALVCRCEEITEEEILQAIADGCTTVDEIKKRTRAGMGFCQGKTCRKLIARYLSAAQKVSMEQTISRSVRMPVGPIPMWLIAETVDGEEPSEQ